MVKGNKNIVAQQLIKQQNQLDDHNEVKKIIREELMNHIQGAGFWDSLKANLGGIIGHASATGSFGTGSGMPPAASASASGSKGTGPLAAGASASGSKRTGPLAAEAPASKPAKAPKKTRKVNPKMAERYALIKQLMKTEGLTMPQASKRAASISKGN